MDCAQDYLTSNIIPSAAQFFGMTSIGWSAAPGIKNLTHFESWYFIARIFSWSQISHNYWIKVAVSACANFMLILSLRWKLLVLDFGIRNLCLLCKILWRENPNPVDWPPFFLRWSAVHEKCMTVLFKSSSYQRVQKFVLLPDIWKMKIARKRCISYPWYHDWRQKPGRCNKRN